jgi:hypothetical protein
MKVESELIDNYSLAQLFIKREILNHKIINISGYIYHDDGGLFWLVSLPDQESSKDYSVRLTNWPFQQSPPIGGHSRHLVLTGEFTRNHEDSKYDFLLGPSNILMKIPPPGFEDQMIPGDPFYEYQKAHLPTRD